MENAEECDAIGAPTGNAGFVAKDFVRIATKIVFVSRRMSAMSVWRRTAMITDAAIANISSSVTIERMPSEKL